MKRQSEIVFQSGQMAELSLCCNSLTPPALPPLLLHPQFSPRIPIGAINQQTRRATTACAAKSGGFSLGSVKSFDLCSSYLLSLIISQVNSFKDDPATIYDQQKYVSMYVVCQYSETVSINI